MQEKILTILKTILRLLPLCIIIALLAYYSWKFPFYEYSQDASDYTMTVETADDSSDFSAAFSYDNQDITLKLSGGLDPSAFQMYGWTDDGIAIMGDEHIANLTSDYSGSFMCVGQVQFGDYNGDGSTDRMFFTAKTDLSFVQDNEMEGKYFGEELSPIEIVLNYRQDVIVYLNNSPAANKEFIVTLANGDKYRMFTDENGLLNELNGKDAWDGFTITYTENNVDYYISSYLAERISLFSYGHLQAMLPFLIIAGISAIGIIFCLVFRRIVERKMYGASYIKRKHSGGHGVRKPFSAYILVRWIVMLATWFIVFYGAHLFGTWYHNIAVPILSCGLDNQDQFVAGACYYLANLDLLVTKPVGQIVMYAITVLGSVIVLGRMLCGFFCPFGMLQDIVHEIRCALNAEGLQFNEKSYARLVPVKWTFVILMIGLCFAGGKFCDICPARTFSPAFAGFKTSLYISGFLMIIVLIGSFFKRRFWCCICPLGFLIGALHKIALFQVTKDSERCTGCGACYEACPMGIKSVYTSRGKKRVTDWDCIFCGECVRSCPESGALSISFCGIKIYKSSRKNVVRAYKKVKK